jgi:autotransporter-associated beta strand protein
MVGLHKAPTPRSHYLTGTALLLLPLVAAPGAVAATVNIPATCTLTAPGVCNATTLLASPGSSTDVITFNGGVLTLNGTALTYAQQATLSAAAGNTLNQDGNTTTFTGVFSDATSGGQITITNTGSGGAVVLGGANAFTGATTINAGATLSLSGNGSISKSSGVADAGTFDISGANGNVAITKVTGAGTISLGTNTVVLSNASGSFTGDIKGSGGVTVAAGSQTFSTAQSYTGTTTINPGATLVLSGSGDIGKSSGVNDLGTFDVSEISTTITSLSGSGAVTLGNNKTLTLSNASGIFSGVVSGGNPSSGLTIAGGSEGLTGANTYKGTTTVNSGATLTGTGSVTGDVSNSGKIRPFDTVSNKAAAFTIGGSYTQASTGVLDIAIGGSPASGNYGQLHVAGKASLDGNLDVDTVNSFLFPVGTTTYGDVLSYSSLSGDFSGFDYNGTACKSNGVDTWLCGTHLTFSLLTGTTSGLRVVRTPEPGTISVLATGLLGLIALRHRRRNR